MGFLKFFKRGLLSLFILVSVEALFAQDFESTSPAEMSIGDISLPPLVPASKVVIQGLDKITGRVLTIETLVGKKIDFGRLKVLVHRCYKSPPEEIPEAIVDIDIYERGSPSGEEVLIFRNKMYASSPSISALDHPIYDIWIKDCF